MPLADLLSSGSTPYVASLLRQGYSYPQARAYLEQRFRGQTPSTYNAALQRGIAAYSAGQRLTLLPDLGPVPAGLVPRGYAPEGGFRYSTNVRIVDPQTGVEYERSVYVTSPQSASAKEVTRLIEATLAEAYQLGNWAVARGYPQPGYLIQDVDIRAIERA